MTNAYRNRSIVLNKKELYPADDPRSLPTQLDAEARIDETEEGGESSQAKNRWVTKHDRHMQLINTSIYDKESQTRQKAIEETRKQKALRRDQREKLKIERHLKVLRPNASQTSASSVAHEILINGLRFQVLDGGSKLGRIRGKRVDMVSRNAEFQDLGSLGPNDSANTTPRKADIGGVTFLRSKSGNLYRSGIVKARR